jgi:5'(3')-deoxyribonucleotidase
MEIKYILLDQDGVLADFCSKALERLNMVYGKKYTISDLVEFGQFDMEKLYKISVTDFWKALEDANRFHDFKKDEFWCFIRPFPWARQLITELRKIAPVIICSAPNKNPQCVAQKLEWLKQYLNIESPDVAFVKKKYLLAKRGNVLIDDYKVNTDKFFAHGGSSILIPSNWNTEDLSFDKVWKVIEDGIDDIRIHW